MCCTYEFWGGLATPGSSGGDSNPWSHVPEAETIPLSTPRRQGNQNRFFKPNSCVEISVYMIYRIGPSQCDQIGRIFAHWAIVYFGHSFENYKSSAHFWTSFVRGTSYVYISTNNWLGHSLGDCFTNSSVHIVYMIHRIGPGEDCFPVTSASLS
jgi:hypothetical protein